MDSSNKRVALVTGASSGIGAEICRQLVKQGMDVIGCARNVQAIEDISREEGVAQSPGKLHARKCDLRNESEILEMHKEIASKFGRLDVCINNAVFSTESTLLHGATSDWRNIIEVGILGLSINTREAVKLMRKNSKDGYIIHIGSITGHKLPPYRNHHVGKPFLWFNIYHSMKLMTRSLAEGLRQELKAINSDIRVSTVIPGAAKTDLLAKASNQQTADEFYGAYECIEPKDVADAVLYILSTPSHTSVNDLVVEPVAYHMAL